MPFARTCAATGGRRQDTRESVAGAAGPPINAPSWPTTVGHVNALPSNDNRISPCRPRCVVRSITASNREETAPGPRAQRSNTRSVNASSAPSATSPSASARPQTHEIGTLWNRSAPAAPVDPVDPVAGVPGDNPTGTVSPPAVAATPAKPAAPANVVDLGSFTNHGGGLMIGGDGGATIGAMTPEERAAAETQKVAMQQQIAESKNTLADSKNTLAASQSMLADMFHAWGAPLP
mmetsp:Transcript_17030/g.51683  ORF Transcript_17030/g.51683 Transcript_17030/m.51683 type:complete len:235 (+) Transcript_17030:1131-1835(+)